MRGEGMRDLPSPATPTIEQPHISRQQAIPFTKA